MKIYLLDYNKEMCDAWNKYFNCFDYAILCVDNILNSLLLAFICSRTTVTPNDKGGTDNQNV